MKVVVFGTGPWPLEPGAIVTGPSIRLRQFVEPLLEARHQVTVVLLEECRRSAIPIAGAVQVVAFGPEEIAEPEVVRTQLDLHAVGAIFGVGSLLPAVAAARLATALDVPCWVDLFGDPLAELHAAQLRQGGAPDMLARDHIWKLLREVLLRGDAFSTVSSPQRHALLGQLGLLGRYGTDWQVCNRLHEIPCGVPESWLEETPLHAFPPILREVGLTESTRFVFFMGSWNVWLDEVMMAKALAAALRADEQLRFVCCGIPTGPAGEQIRHALLNDLKDFRTRVIELPPQHLDQESMLLSWAGACLSLDREIPEAELGSRNRLLAMVRWGARPVVSLEAGLETELVAEGLASGVVKGNWDRAAKEILVACGRGREERLADRRHGLDYLRSLTFNATLEPAVTWLSQGPSRWPETPGTGMVDRWASFPADPAKLFEQEPKKRSWFFR